MDWFNIIGTILGFVGSVIFSAALLKGDQQIKDENKTFFSANPYTYRNETETQKYYRLAFALLIAGFAVIIGGELRKNFDNYPVLIGALIAVTLTSVGLMLAILLYNRRVKKHSEMRTEVNKSNFVNYIKSLKRDMVKTANKSLKAETYRGNQDYRFKNLENTISQIPTEQASKELDLLRELKEVESVEDMIELAKTFLDEQKSSS